jgi:tRNA threonylcarbamoyladenosine biosynthesis protein TsaB
LLILGLDTSGRQGSVALLRAHGAELIAIELAPVSGGHYSERLVPTIAELLARHGLERSAIGLIAVASGPGSFTGLRVAIATVKGLAEPFAIPVVAISVLQAVALASSVEGNVVPALDAQRNEVFFGNYLLAPTAPEPARMEREGLCNFLDFSTHLAAPPARVFTPDAVLAERLHEAGADAHLLARPSAEAYARIAYRKFLAGERADIATLDANYLRRSDAEIFSAPKLGVVPH